MTFPGPHFSVHVQPNARSRCTSDSNLVESSGFKWTYRRTGARFATRPTLMMDRLRKRGTDIVARPVMRPGSMTSVFGARLEQLQAMSTSASRTAWTFWRGVVSSSPHGSCPALRIRQSPLARRGRTTFSTAPYSSPQCREASGRSVLHRSVPLPPTIIGSLAAGASVVV